MAAALQLQSIHQTTWELLHRLHLHATDRHQQQQHDDTIASMYSFLATNYLDIFRLARPNLTDSKPSCIILYLNTL